MTTVTSSTATSSAVTSSAVTSPARSSPWSPCSTYRLTLLPRPDLPRADPDAAADRSGLLERRRRLALGADAGLALAVVLPFAWLASWPGAGPGAWPTALTAAAALWARCLVHRSIAGMSLRGRRVRRVLVVGSPDSAARMISRLDSMRERRLAPIGAYLRLGPTGAAGCAGQLSVDELLDVVGEVSADTVVLADEHAEYSDPQATARIESALADRAVVLLAVTGEEPWRVGGTAGRVRTFCDTVDWASAAVQSSWSVRRRPR